MIDKIRKHPRIALLVWFAWLTGASFLMRVGFEIFEESQGWMVAWFWLIGILAFGLPYLLYRYLSRKED